MPGFCHLLVSAHDLLKNVHIRRNDLPIRGLRVYHLTHGEPW